MHKAYREAIAKMYASASAPRTDGLRTITVDGDQYHALYWLSKLSEGTSGLTDQNGRPVDIRIPDGYVPYQSVIGDVKAEIAEHIEDGTEAERAAREWTDSATPSYTYHLYLLLAEESSIGDEDVADYGDPGDLDQALRGAVYAHLRNVANVAIEAMREERPHLFDEDCGDPECKACYPQDETETTND